MKWLMALGAVAAGCFSTPQSGTNSMLSKTLDQPIFAALAVALGNIAIYLVAGIFVGMDWPSQERFAQVPWWAWVGGILGGYYVLAMIFFAEKLGAAVFTGFNVTAAIVTSILLDHYGLIGFKPHAVNAWRILGAVMMIGGLTLVSKF